MQTYAFGLNDVKLYTGVNTGAGTYDQMAEVESAQMLVTELTTQQSRLEGDDCIVDVVTRITSVEFTVRFGFRDLDVLQLITGIEVEASDEFEAMTFGRDTLGEFALYGVAQGTDGDETLGVFIPRCKILESFGCTLEKGTYVTPELSGVGVYDDEEGYAMAIGNAHGLATMGVPVGGGGFSLRDNFDTLADYWAAQLGVAAAASGALQGNTLALDENWNLLTNGNMETGDPPSGWASFASAVLSSVADERTGGSGTKSLNAARGTNNLVAFQNIRVVPGALHSLTAWIKNIDATSGDFRPAFISLPLSLDPPEVSATSWTQVTDSGVAGASSSEIMRFYANGSQGQSARLDDAVLLTSAILYTNTKTAYANGIITAGVIMPASDTVARGLVFRYADASNYWLVLIYPNTAGNDLLLIKRESGVETIIEQADVDWTAAATDSVRVSFTDAAVAIDHKKSGASEWTRAITYGSATFNQTETAHGFIVYDTGNATLDSWYFDEHG